LEGKANYCSADSDFTPPPRLPPVWQSSNLDVSSSPFHFSLQQSLTTFPDTRSLFSTQFPFSSVIKDEFFHNIHSPPSHTPPPCFMVNSSYHPLPHPEPCTSASEVGALLPLHLEPSSPCGGAGEDALGPLAAAAAALKAGRPLPPLALLLAGLQSQRLASFAAA
jgi:hypothetical protein